MGSVRVVQLTDLHLLKTPGELLYGVDSGAALEQAVIQLSALNPKPSALVLTGDIAQDGEPMSYHRVAEILKCLQVPIYALPGNHDDLTNMRAAWSETNIAILQTVSWHQWSCIPIDSTIAGRDHGNIDETRLRQLQQALAQAGSHHVLIALHHGPSYHCSAFDCLLQNRDQLLQLLSQYPCVKGVIAGHIHCHGDETVNAIRLMATPSSFLHVTHHSRDPNTDHSDVRATHTIDGSKRGYRLIDLHESGTISTAVHWF